jgi:hypothetical protein
MAFDAPDFDVDAFLSGTGDYDSAGGGGGAAAAHPFGFIFDTGVISGSAPSPMASEFLTTAPTSATIPAPPPMAVASDPVALAPTIATVSPATTHLKMMQSSKYASGVQVDCDYEHHDGRQTDRQVPPGAVDIVDPTWVDGDQYNFSCIGAEGKGASDPANIDNSGHTPRGNGRTTFRMQDVTRPGGPGANRSLHDGTYTVSMVKTSAGGVTTTCQFKVQMEKDRSLAFKGLIDMLPMDLKAELAAVLCQKLAQALAREPEKKKRKQLEQGGRSATRARAQLEAAAQPVMRSLSTPCFRSLSATPTSFRNLGAANPPQSSIDDDLCACLGMLSKASLNEVRSFMQQRQPTPRFFGSL